MIYNNELYLNVLKENCKIYDKLSIISGYASASFLERIIEEFPNLKIELFIGMSQEGVLRANHKQYLRIMSINKNVNIYYQYKAALTHIKAYVFSNSEETKSFAGSANFTENGFIFNNELLCETNESLNELFDDQKKKSKLCNDKSINEYLQIVDKRNLREDIFNDIDSIKKNIKEFNKKNNIKSDLKVDNSDVFIKLPIVVPLKANKRWDSSGINGEFSNRNPHLIKSNYNNVADMKSFFIQDAELDIIDFKGESIKGKLDGEFNRELHFLNINLYDYFSNIIGLKEKTPITHEHLEYFGYKFFTFKKVDSNKYLLTFTN